MFIANSLLFASGAFLLAACVPAMAQTTGSARPFHGALFGVRHADTSAQRLDVSITALEAYDDNVFASFGATVDPNQQQVGGFYSMLQPSADFGWKGRRAQIGISGASAFGYYPQLKSVRSISHTAGAGFAAQLARRSTLMFNQTAAYSPSYLYGLFPTGGEVVPGDPLPAAPNYSVNDVESYSYGSVVSLSQGISRRSSVSVGGNYRFTDFVHETAAQRDIVSKGLDSELAHQRTKKVSLRLSYHYLAGNLGYGPSVTTHEQRLEGGVSYSRPLSATRRATFGFNLGSSAVSTVGDSRELQFPARVYRASGDASFDYQFALSWQASGAYRRRLEFVPGVSQPVFTNGVSVGLDGLVHRRVQVGIAGGYSEGRSAILSNASQFNTSNVSARLQYALTSSTAIDVDYLYYFYDFLGGLPLVSGPPRVQRNGVRIGLRLLIPALRG